MAGTITFRTDAETLRALETLTADGTPVSSAVRAALLDAALQRRRQQIRAQAEQLAADPEDRAEMARVRQEMDELRAW